MELSAVDPWGGPAAAATVGSAGPSPPPTVPAPAASGPWGTASTDPWGVASPTSPTSSDPWGGGAPPTIAPPPDPWGETSNRVNNVDPWGSSGKQLQNWSRSSSVACQVGSNVIIAEYQKGEPHPALWMKEDVETSWPLLLFTPLFHFLSSQKPCSIFCQCLHAVTSSHPLTCFQYVMKEASMLNPFSLCV